MRSHLPLRIVGRSANQWRLSFEVTEEASSHDDLQLQLYLVEHFLSEINHAVLRTIQHCRSDCCPIELSFQLSNTFLSHKTPEALLHFNHPT